MSANSNKPTAKLGLYTPLADTVRSQSGAPMDVPLDAATRRFTPGYIQRTVDPEISDIKAQTAFTDRVHNRELLLVNAYRSKDSTGSKSTDNNNIKKKKKKGVKLSAREQRQLRVYEIPKEAHKHALFVPLNRMWNEYARRLLGEKAKGGLDLARLVKADLHGAELKVLRSKCPGFVGIQGIVAQETKNVFRVVTADDRLLTVPKARSVFEIRFAWTQTRGVVYGDQFAFRASERAARKFKPKPTVDLA
ncbi:RNase P/RNase MRP complex subunit [Coemansia erecta]|uniref:RNase P/RNase MRP complex subunit n=1 Tax=Coemansia erecta TaxID=147472 RepID=A0A9W7XVT5_9FUNG|nr:RNase P/RNase MRP complex subunit [Coemansia erecta]